MFVNDLCRHFYPGIVTHKGNTEPAKLWDHYKDALDACGDK